MTCELDIQYHHRPLIIHHPVERTPPHTTEWSAIIVLFQLIVGSFQSIDSLCMFELQALAPPLTRTRTLRNSRQPLFPSRGPVGVSIAPITLNWLIPKINIPSSVFSTDYWTRQFDLSIHPSVLTDHSINMYPTDDSGQTGSHRHRHPIWMSELFLIGGDRWWWRTSYDMVKEKTTISLLCSTFSRGFPGINCSTMEPIDNHHKSCTSHLMIPWRPVAGPSAPLAGN